MDDQAAARPQDGAIMTPEEQSALVKKHYALNTAGDHAAARELLTDDFCITIPPCMPFAGEYRGKDAFRTLIPLVAETVGLASVKYIATTIGDDHAVEIVEFSLADGSTVDGAEVIRFRGHQICDIRPFYFDPTPMIAVAAQSKESGDSPA
ncbi:nuclear transport factor 2 family protein [Streptomyces sp. NPDC033538]|uniref:nuclear transport factor 2 family protein n=1 Tax=Streptomyces sp. NPDC033538 TaxID=3155367 RepID=UPI0033EA40EE